jgi:Ca2+-binding RTX toxin-like protein
MTGGTGDDTYVVDNTGDTVNEVNGQGVDTVLSGVTRTLDANLEKLVLIGTGAINGTANSTGAYLIGNSGANILTGDIGNDTFASGAGNDTMNGRAGNDRYAFARGDGKDLVIDNGGNDKLTFALTGGTGERINYDNLWFEQIGNNLAIRPMGSPTDAITIRDWYAGTANQVESIEAAAGSEGSSL